MPAAANGAHARERPAAAVPSRPRGARRSLRSALAGVPVHPCVPEDAPRRKLVTRSAEKPNILDRGRPSPRPRHDVIELEPLGGAADRARLEPPLAAAAGAEPDRALHVRRHRVGARGARLLARLVDEPSMTVERQSRPSRRAASTSGSFWTSSAAVFRYWAAPAERPSSRRRKVKREAWPRSRQSFLRSKSGSKGPRPTPAAIAPLGRPQTQRESPSPSGAPPKSESRGTVSIVTDGQMGTSLSRVVGRGSEIR